MSAGPAPGASHTLPPGTKLQNGKFSVGKVLGQGGFGITYLGSDVPLRRSVAIKEFFPQGCQRHHNTVQAAGAITVADYQGAKAQFLDEARVLAQFQHPGIVHVYTFFEENNTAYMVMDFLKGKTLLKLLEERQALPERDAIGYVEQVGEALEVVHRANVLHRDLKPENIIVTEDGRAVLLDFGTAREFAAGSTKRMTAMLTPGYAPLEQYTHQARFGPFTDCYALGATLYHLLTGQLPAQATDRIAGVALTAPHRLNSSVSQTVSAAVMWALEMQVDKRPQSVREFLRALRGGPNPNRNPHEERMQQIVTELARPAPPPSENWWEPRIREVQASLARLEGFLVPLADQCPGCNRRTLVRVTGEPTDHCPVCPRGTLAWREFSGNACPVCRTGELAKQTDKRIFCPVCRKGGLRKEKRSWLLGTEEFGVCTACKAELKLVGDNKAKLVVVHEDPYSTGKLYYGATLSLLKWKHLGCPHGAHWTCASCGARLEEQEDKRLALVHAAADPHGVGKMFVGKSLFRKTWARIALGLPPNAGNRFCQQCGADFDCDQDQGTLKLIRCDEQAFPWTAQWRGQPIPLQAWYLAASGKQSLCPGWFCSSCNTEFDADGDRLKLVSSSASPLSGLAGLQYSIEDWHRRCNGLPSTAEERELREELKGLFFRRRQEMESLQQQQQQRLSQLKAELQRLLKASVVEGFAPFQQQLSQLPLRDGETLRWESPAIKMKQRSSRGSIYWDSEMRGTLLVTTERILFDAPPDKLWQRSIGKLLRADSQHLQGRQLVVLWLDGLQKPIGFFLTEFQVSVSIGGQPHTLTLGPSDLLRSLQCQGNAKEQ